MNALTTIQYNEALPDFLRDPAYFTLSDSVAAGIGGSQPPYVSIKASKWRLVDASGEEEMVNQLHLDVVIIQANDHVSKIFYKDKYDPAAGNSVPPTCFSDNGVAPSDRASEPQSPTCASCPNGAWGSAVSQVSGKSIKACVDAKKLAVVLAIDVPTIKGGIAGVARAGAQAYQLRVPATSMRAIADVAKMVKARGVPLIGTIIRLTFDAEASYPLISFVPVDFIKDRAFFDRVKALSAGEEVKEIVGANDRPFAGAALPQEVAVRFVGEAASGVVPPTPSPSASAPASPAFPAAPSAAFPASASTAGSPAAPSAPTAEAPPKRRRGAPTKEERAPLAAAPSVFDGAPGQPPIQTQPSASNAQLDALVADVFKM